MLQFGEFWLEKISNLTACLQPLFKKTELFGNLMIGDFYKTALYLKGKSLIKKTNKKTEFRKLAENTF